MDIRSRLRAIAAGESSESAEAGNTQSNIRQRLREIAAGESSESTQPVHAQSDIRQRLREIAAGTGSESTQPVQNAPVPGTAAMEKIKGWQKTKKAESDPARTTNKIVLGSQMIQNTIQRGRENGRPAGYYSEGYGRELKQRKDTAFENAKNQSPEATAASSAAATALREFESNSKNYIEYPDGSVHVRPELQTRYRQLRQNMEANDASAEYAQLNREYNAWQSERYLHERDSALRSLSADEKNMLIAISRVENDKYGQYTEAQAAEWKAARDYFKAKGWSDRDIKLYLEYYTDSENERLTNEMREKTAASIEEHPVVGGILHSAASVAAAPAKALGIVEGVRSILPTGLGGYVSENRPTDVNSPLFAASNYSATVRQTVKEQINSPVGAFLYEAGMSAADSALNLALARGVTAGLGIGATQEAVAMTTSVIMGSQVAADTVINEIEKGNSNEKAFALGIVRAVIEGITEKYSIEAFLKEPKTVAAALGKSFVAEGSEEVASNWLNRVVDIVAEGDKADLQLQLKAYMDQGYSEAAALALAIVGEDAKSFLAGGISGIAMSGTAFATGALRTAARNERMSNAFAEAVMANPTAQDALREATGIEPMPYDSHRKQRADVKQGLRQAAKGQAENGTEAVQNQQGDSLPAASPLNDGNNDQQESAVELQRRSPNNIVLPELPGEMPGGKVWPGDSGTQSENGGMSTPQSELRSDSSPYTGEPDAERRQRAAKAGDETERTGILAGVKDEYIQLARRLGKATGRSIVFFDEAAGESGSMNNGFYNPDDGSLHINARSGNPVAQIISHELTHSIEDSGFYDKLSRLVFDRMRREGADISALRQAKRELYAKNGKALDGYGEVDAELVAEYVEKNLLTDEAAIRAVVDYDRTLGQRILDFLNNLLGRLGSKSARERLFLSRAKRYYQAALEETQESSARAGRTVAEHEGRISRIGEQLRSGELTDEQAEAVFNETYDPELDLRRNGAMEENESRRRYSIINTESGKRYVRADRQVIFGNDPQSWSEQLEDYINGKIRRGQDVTLIGADGDELQLTATSAGKLSDNHTGDGRTMSDTAYELKANAAAHIDELAQISEKKGKIKPDKGNRHGNMASGGWEYRTAHFEDFNGKYYEVTISAAVGNDGKIVYNIGQTKEEAHPKIKGSRAISDDGPRGFASSDTSIRESGENVNRKFSISEENTETAPSESRTKQREDEYQAELNGFPQINGVQIVPYKTQVHASDIMSDEYGNMLRDANGEVRRRDNYGIVTGLDRGMPGRLLVSFRNDEYGTRANNVSIAPEDLEPVSKYEYAAEKAFDDTMKQEPLDSANEQLSAEEQAEIANMRQAAEQRDLDAYKENFFRLKYDDLAREVPEAEPELTAEQQKEAYDELDSIRKELSAAEEANMIRQIFEQPVPPPGPQLSAEEQAKLNNLLQAAWQQDNPAPEVTPVHREQLDKAAVRYLENAENHMVNRIARKLNIPSLVDKSSLVPIAQAISDAYLRDGYVSDEVKQEQFAQAYSKGAELANRFYTEYADLAGKIEESVINISQLSKGDATYLKNAVRRADNLLRLTNDSGISVDELYEQLSAAVPNFFPANIRDSKYATAEETKLNNIIRFAKNYSRAWKNVKDYFSDQYEDFEYFARNDFDDAINSSISDLKTVRRYGGDQATKAAKQEKLQTSAPMNTQQARDAYAQLKKARWNFERAKARNLLSNNDILQLGKLLRGEILEKNLDRYSDNVEGIKAVYEAQSEYEELVQQINDYKQSIRAQAAAKADEYLKTANRWKDKAVGLAYARETMERNIEDIVSDKKLAADIIREYITPVHDAEAASTRFKNQMRDRVRKLGLGTKPAKGNEVSEAYAVQLLGEAEDNIRVLRESRGRLESRDGKTAEEWAAEIVELKEHNPNMDWGKIENAVDEFRKIYDELIDRLNEARVRNGYEPINYRSGYFPHFQAGEDGGALARMGRALGITTGVETLPTTINGLTSQFKPGIRWFSAAQERRGYNTVYDAVQGFERYINGAADVIFHTDNIQALRTLANQIRKRTSDEGIRTQINEVEKSRELTEEQKDELKKQIYESGRYSLSNFVAELDEYTNLLAGKKSRYDRAMESMFGRRAYTIMKNIESRVGANMVGGNFGSALTNFIPLTQAWGQIDTRSMLQGMWQTLKAYKESDGMVDASSFLTNRRGSDPVVQTWLQKASSAMGKPMEFIDSFTSGSIIRARYAQNLRHGMSEAAAMSEADAFAAKVMADRSKGSLPTLFESRNPLFKAFTQFQLEVNNQFSEVFKDLPKIRRDKGLKALAAALFKYFVGAYMYNELYEFLVGRRPALDPLGILNDTVGDFTGYELPNLFELGAGAITGDMPSFRTEKQGAGTSFQNLGTNLLGELPFSSGLNLLGIDVDGGRLPVASAIPDVANILSAATKSGVSGKKRAKTILDELMKPAAYLLPPFGGNQAQKIWKSVYALSQGGSYTMDNEGNAKLQYPIYSDDKGSYALDFSRMVLFGKSSLKEAREWAENNYNTLSAKQTAAYQDMVDNGENQRKAYDIVDELRQAEKTDDQTKKYIQCEMLRSADISGESRAIAYRTLLASEKEAELMDSFDAGTDLGQITNILIDMYEAKKTDGKLAVLADAGLTKDETINFLAYLMGDELYTENGNKTQFAKMQLCLEMGMSVKDVIGAKLNGESFDKILKELGADEDSDSGWASPWGNRSEDGWASPWGKQDENGWASPWD